MLQKYGTQKSRKPTKYFQPLRARVALAEEDRLDPRNLQQPSTEDFHVE